MSDAPFTPVELAAPMEQYIKADWEGLTAAGPATLATLNDPATCAACGGTVIGQAVHNAELDLYWHPELDHCLTNAAAIEATY